MAFHFYRLLRRFLLLTIVECSISAQPVENIFSKLLLNNTKEDSNEQVDDRSPVSRSPPRRLSYDIDDMCTPDKKQSEVLAERDCILPAEEIAGFTYSNHSYWCDYCGKFFSNGDYAREHYDQEHANDEHIYRCQRCPLEFAHAHELDEHQRGHIREDEERMHYVTRLLDRAKLSTEKFICGNCKRSFQNKKLYQAHRTAKQCHIFHLPQRIHEPKPSKGTALFQQVHKSSSHSYKSLGHSSVKQSVSSNSIHESTKLQHLKCESCALHFSTDTAYTSHLKNCHVCFKAKNSNDDNSKHKPSCVPIEKSPNNMKTSSAISPSKLAKPYSCYRCNATFVRIFDLCSHQRVHSTNLFSMYSCDLCNMAFERVLQLSNHRRVCGKSKTSQEQNDSSREKIKFNSPGKSLDGPHHLLIYKCKRCGDRFSEKTDFKEHGQFCNLKVNDKERVQKKHTKLKHKHSRSESEDHNVKLKSAGLMTTVSSAHFMPPLESEQITTIVYQKDAMGQGSITSASSNVRVSDRSAHCVDTTDSTHSKKQVSNYTAIRRESMDRSKEGIPGMKPTETDDKSHRQSAPKREQMGGNLKRIMSTKSQDRHTVKKMRHKKEKHNTKEKGKHTTSIQEMQSSKKNIPESETVSGIGIDGASQSMCKESGETVGTIVKHYKSKHAAVRYDCDICGRKFGTIKLLTSHQLKNCAKDAHELGHYSYNSEVDDLPLEKRMKSYAAESEHNHLSFDKPLKDINDRIKEGIKVSDVVNQAWDKLVDSVIQQDACLKQEEEITLPNTSFGESPVAKHETSPTSVDRRSKRTIKRKLYNDAITDDILNYDIDGIVDHLLVKNDTLEKRSHAANLLHTSSIEDDKKQKRCVKKKAVLDYSEITAGGQKQISQSKPCRTKTSHTTVLSKNSEITVLSRNKSCEKINEIVTDTNNIVKSEENTINDLLTNTRVGKNMNHRPIRTKSIDSDKSVGDQPDTKTIELKTPPAMLFTVDSSEPSRIVYRCDTCLNAFNSRSRIVRHLKIHQPPAYSCTHCDSKYYERYQLVQHLRNKHDLLK